MKRYTFNTLVLVCSFFLLAMIAGTGCKNMIEVPTPTTQVVSQNVFSNDQTATSAVVGLYSQMMTTNLYFMNGAMSVYTGLSADEIVNNTTNANYDPFRTNTLQADNYVIQNAIWRYAYIFIYQANACIDGLNKSTGVSEATRQQLIGEMEFSRAVCYFYLVNLFGDVPLETTTSYTANEVMARTKSSDIYAQIITDLQTAESLLSTSYPTAGPTRPNKWAAAALLARVYLYQKDWKDAQQQASAVIGSGMYSLISNLNNVFLANSQEAIWQMIPVSTLYNTAEGGTFIPTSATARPAFSLNSYLLNAFEPGDQRLVNWVTKTTVGGITYYYPYKYKVRIGSAKTENENILRLAEQYLIRAEAEAEQGDITDATTDINMIRQRAGLSALPGTLSQADCLTAISQENRIEFFTEWGHRWFDLKRKGQADNILGNEKTGWTSHDALYPIPSSEIQLNHNLTQNPGY